MEIAVVSDLHGFLNFELNPVELLLIAGDICPYGNESVTYQQDWLKNVLAPKIKSQPVELCFLVAGNHDYWFERNAWNETLIHQILYQPSDGKICYLHNEGYTYYDTDGEQWKIFGTPFCKMDGNMAFMRSDLELKERYNAIQEGLDILISHDTPRFLEFSSVKDTEGDYGMPSGNYELREAIIRSKPKYTFCGHIHHPSQGLIDLGYTKIQNVSQRLHGKDTGIINYLTIEK